ncbi:MAG: hypothetical protein AAFQ63_00720 [Cyanobacteria bacterium J06621_11]
MAVDFELDDFELDDFGVIALEQHRNSGPVNQLFHCQKRTFQGYVSG